MPSRKAGWSKSNGGKKEKNAIPGHPLDIWRRFPKAWRQLPNLETVPIFLGDRSQNSWRQFPYSLETVPKIMI